VSREPLAFIGFSEKFSQVVKATYKIADGLRTRGVGSYIAREDRQYGQSVTRKVHEAIARSDAAVFVWTRSAYDSARVNDELEYALNAGKPVILLRYQNTPLHHLWVENDWEYQKLEGVTILSGVLGPALGPSYNLPRFDRMLENVAGFIRSAAAPSG
jgi:TIR domain